MYVQGKRDTTRRNGRTDGGIIYVPRGNFKGKNISERGEREKIEQEFLESFSGWREDIEKCFMICSSRKLPKMN